MARFNQRAQDRLLTCVYEYPTPSPAWLRTTSRRRRAGTRRLKRLVHRGHARLWCW